MTTSTYDAANRLLTAAAFSGITSYSYDAAGNRTLVVEPTGDITTQTWDAQNHLVQVELPTGDVVTYTWAPVNKAAEERIVVRDAGDGPVHWLWDNNNVLRETDGFGTVLAETSYAPEAYGDLISRRADGSTAFAQYDALGNTTALTDASGTLTDDFSYEAFGQVAASTGSTDTPYQWIGQLGYRRDETTGQSNLRSRDYDPQPGRFLSADPLGLASGDSNFYRYVANDPINQVDPSGLKTVEVDFRDGTGRCAFMVYDASGKLLGSFPYQCTDIEQWRSARQKADRLDPESEKQKTGWQCYWNGELVDPIGYGQTVRTACRKLDWLNPAGIPLGSATSAVLSQMAGPEVMNCKDQRCPNATEQAINWIGDSTQQAVQGLQAGQQLQQAFNGQLNPGQVALGMLPGAITTLSQELVEADLATCEQQLKCLPASDLEGREQWHRKIFEDRVALVVLKNLDRIKPNACQPEALRDVVAAIRQLVEEERKRVKAVLEQAERLQGQAGGKQAFANNFIPGLMQRLDDLDDVFVLVGKANDNVSLIALLLAIATIGATVGMVIALKPEDDDEEKPEEPDSPEPQGEQEAGDAPRAFNPANFVGKQATHPPHLPAGKYPALVIDGEVYVGRMHNVAWELAGKKGVEQFYGFAEIDAAGKVVSLFK